MKKLIAIAVALIAMSGAVFAQKVSAWNEVMVDPINVDGNTANFGQLRERMHASVSASMFSAEARYEVSLKPNGSWFGNGANLYQKPLKANIYIRPVSGLELILGNDYDKKLPGSERTDASDDLGKGPGRESYLGVAQFGHNGFGVVFTGVENLVLGAAVPGDQLWGPNGGIGLNFAVGYKVAPAALDLGLALKSSLLGSNSVDLGFYINWAGIKNLRLALGYTAFGNFNNHDIAFVFGYDFGILGMEVAFDFNTGGNSFQVDGGVKGDINKTVSWYVRALYENGGNANTWKVLVKPGISCTLGNHTLGAAVKLGSDNNKFQLSIPLSWKYTFK